MSPFYPSSHVADLPATAHPPERAHTHRPGCSPGLLCRRAQRAHPLTRRLDADERKAIRSGNVYIWEDRSASTVDNGGITMERWYAWRFARRGRFTSSCPSPFFSKDRRNVMGTIAHTRGVSILLSKRPSQERLPSGGGKMSFPLHDSDKLIKQTYSVYVFLPEDRGQDITRKWHLTAYFKQRNVDELTPIEDIPNVGRIPVPEGLFKSARATKSKRDAPNRNVLGTPTGSDSYTVTSNSGVLCTIFPSSGNGPQTAHAYTQDGSSRSLSMAPVPIAADPSAPARSVFASRSTTQPPSSRPIPRLVPITAAHTRPPHQQTPSLVPLEFLQACSNNRAPTDVQMLQQLSASHSPGAEPSRSPIGPGRNAGRTTPYNGV
ncbi:hypothetical protein BJV77DRAFT_1067784 [Russula vinacea]|nr:hypothetical protein BJV77DRAFT_1067784 [Russula vinacea]